MQILLAHVHREITMAAMANHTKDMYRKVWERQHLHKKYNKETEGRHGASDYKTYFTQ